MRQVSGGENNVGIIPLSSLTGPTDVEEPNPRWWDAIELCIREAVTSRPAVGRRPRPMYEKIILGARVFVLLLLIIFNIVYWTLALI